MEPPSLSRYEKDPDGRVVIEVATRDARDLFNRFDRFAPYPKKDLNQDLADYLVDCAREIGANPFRIQILLEEPSPSLPDPDVMQGLRGFFRHLCRQERRLHRRLLRHFLLLTGLGLLLLLGTILLSPHAATAPLGLRVSFEGLVVAAWIALWEGTSRLLFETPPIRQNIRVYRRLAEADVRVGPG